MSVFSRDPDLRPGVYDEVVTVALDAKLAALAESHAVERRVINEQTDIDEQLVTLIRDAARLALRSRKGSTEKLALAQRALSALAVESPFRTGETTLGAELLRSVQTRVQGLPPAARNPPRATLLGSQLLTNAHDESVLDHLRSEFESADRIDLLCAFIKLSGLDKFRGPVERHLSLGKPLRVLTTTYMCATDAKAVEVLHRLGAQVRVSYDSTSTRLHAKAWVFHRESGYGTAYVGSSNLSHAAQTDGLEWNVRIAQAEQPGLHDEMADVFEGYFRDDDKFETFDGTEHARVKLSRSLEERRRDGTFANVELEPKDWQKPILRELVDARAAGRHQNLVVAATGTGKTLIAAFDYRDLAQGGALPSLLFIAHRREILEQARDMFRLVLQNGSFGELWVDGRRPTEGKHVFASIQSLSHADELAPDAFSVVIVDEVHHAAARTYETLLSQLAPRELLGLSATPERADGRLYDKHFPRPYVGNLRVWDAIQQQVLVPFRFFVLDAEGVDLSDAKWDGGYVDSDLSARLIKAGDFWVKAIVRALRDRIARPESVRALAFCVDKAHARAVAERLTRDADLVARALTDDTPSEERDRAKADLVSGAVQVLCVVDLFNEGVDIPDVNTLFLFRPTESATVFLQQLGRGLRRHRAKDMLTVFDVTGRQHPRFRFDRNLRALLGHSPRELRDFVETGFGRLPSGCLLQFEEKSQRDILERIKRAVPTDIRGLREVLRDHKHEGWDLATFLAETEVDLLDLYRSKRSWSSLRADVGLMTPPEDAGERAALESVQRMMHVTDSLRLGMLERLLDGEAPRTEAERRLTMMLFALLFDVFEVRALDAMLTRLRSYRALCDELRALIPILRERADRLPLDTPLADDIPLLLHAEYRDLELSAAFNAITKDGKLRHFYTGVESVNDGRYDLLLATLDQGKVAHEHLHYHDFPLSPTRFQWQSQARTRVDDAVGQRHVAPASSGVTPILLVREASDDARGIRQPFRNLGAVAPVSHRGERPITIEWQLGTSLKDEWLRKWRAS